MKSIRCRDDEGVFARVRALGGLNGGETPGTLIGPINQVILTAGDEDEPFTMVRYQWAVRIEQIADPGEKQKAMDGGAPKLTDFHRAVDSSAEDFLRDELEDLGAAMEEFDKLCKVLDEKCGKDENGHPRMPPISRIRATIEGILDLMKSATKDKLAPEERRRRSRRGRRGGRAGQR